MTVYVDTLRLARIRAAKSRWESIPRMWCHMIADTLEELHEFAVRIQLRNSWFQGDHYDLTLARRADAIALGAIEITREQAVEMRRAARAAEKEVG